MFVPCTVNKSGDCHGNEARIHVVRHEPVISIRPWSIVLNCHIAIVILLLRLCRLCLAYIHRKEAFEHYAGIIASGTR